MPKLLRNKITGVVFPYNDIIAKQAQMEPYDPEEAVVKEKPVKKEVIVEQKPEPEVVEEPFPEWEARAKDGPVLRDVIKLANRKRIDIGSLEKFNPSPSDFKAEYSRMAVKAAVSEFKQRVLDGE